MGVQPHQDLGEQQEQIGVHRALMHFVQYLPQNRNGEAR